LIEFPKNSTNNAIILADVHEILNSFYDVLIFNTNDSLSRNLVRAAYSIEDELYSFRLCNSASIFTAELLAVYHGLQTI